MEMDTEKKKMQEELTRVLLKKAALKKNILRN